MADKELKYKLTLQDLFSKKMQGAVDSTKSMDSAMSGIGSKLAGLGATIGVGALAKEMVTTGAKFDSYKLQLETLLGSQKQASSAFNKIKEDAAKTPFDVASLTQANAMLISAGSGADDARKMVMNLGNAIAATGGGSDELSRMSVNLQQIKTLGKASAMDIKQFAFAGIPIYQMLAKTTGKTIEQVREMDVTYEQLSQSFEKAAQKGGMFYGGLEKQSGAIGGQLSNLGDQATNTLVGFYDRLKPTISSIIKLLSDTLAWVSKNQETIIFIGKIVGIVWLAVGAFKAWALVNTVQLVPSILAANAAMAANPVGAVIVAVSALVAVLATLISEYRTVQQLHEESMRKTMSSAFEEESKQVEFLTGKYEKLGRTKLEAQQMAIAASKKMLKSDLAEVQSQLAGATTDEQRRIAQKRLADLGGRGQALKELEAQASGGLAAKGSSASVAGSTSKSLGSSTDVSSVRPQSLVININDGLVKELKVISDGTVDNINNWAQKVRQEVSKVLLETANDANLAAR